MPDPITTAIATAVAGGAATALTAEAARVLKDIASRIRRRLQGDPRAPALPASPGDAGSPEAAGALAVRLQQLFHSEPAFQEELTALWDQYRDAGGVTAVSHFHGDVHTSIVIGEHNGDLNING